MTSRTTTRRSDARADEAAEILRRLTLSPAERLRERMSEAVGDVAGLTHHEVGKRVAGAVHNLLEGKYSCAYFQRPGDGAEVYRVLVSDEGGQGITLKISAGTIEEVE